MNEQELRRLVREAIARQSQISTIGMIQTPGAVPRSHPSHGMFRLPEESDADGRCLIEPVVTCNHCGYCKSYGH